MGRVPTTPSIPEAKPIMSNPLRSAILALLIVVWAQASLANPDEGLKVLAEQAAVLVLRHAQTVPGTGDPAGFRLDDCATQRNLNDRGREQARAMGQALRAAGVKSARIYASPWCRSRETAELLDLGPVEINALLASTWNDRVVNPDRADELRRVILGWEGPEAMILVTHGINVRQLLGRSPRQGGGFVVLPDPQNPTTLSIVSALP